MTIAVDWDLKHQTKQINNIKALLIIRGAHRLSDRVLDLRSRGQEFETNQRQIVLSLSKTLCPLLGTGSTQEDMILSRYD